MNPVHTCARAPIDMRDVLATPYKLGGRTLGKEGDCLLATLTGAQRQVGCAPDPWPAIRADWEAGKLTPSSGFPPCWFRLPDDQARRDGDVLLFYGAEPWSAVVVDGYVYSSDKEAGAYCVPSFRWHKKPAEHWRHDPAAHQEGTAGRRAT